MNASRRDEVRSAVGRLYTQIESEVALHRPLCVASGRCCRFEEYGHRLYVTTLELAAFLAELPIGDSERSIQEGGCPFQTGRLCGVHAIRPMGCRLFFCDATSTAWQQDLYERLHQKLRELHSALKVPYFYIEWREALKAVSRR